MYGLICFRGSVNLSLEDFYSAISLGLRVYIHDREHGKFVDVALVPG